MIRLVYKYVESVNGVLHSPSLPSFIYELGKVKEYEKINEYSGIYCFFKHTVNQVGRKTKELFTLIEMEVYEEDLLRVELDRVPVYRKVKPLRIVEREEYETWRGL